MTTINRIGVLAHPQRPHTFPVAADIAAKIAAERVEAWSFEAWSLDDVRDAMRDTDVLIAIGGDGAMLRAARVGALFDVPVLGVNMGMLGFLTEVSTPADAPRAIARLLAGEYWVETRTMLAAAVLHDDHMTGIAGEALNDIVISGNAVGRMTHLQTYIDGDWATTYNADALVIATATGSTAYALSCGGPILPPELRNVLIVPAAPHLSMERPIVLSEGAQVMVRPTSSNRTPVLLQADGAELGEIAPGATVHVKVSDKVARFIRLRERNYFYRSLLDRLEPRVNAVTDRR